MIPDAEVKVHATTTMHVHATMVIPENSANTKVTNTI